MQSSISLRHEPACQYLLRLGDTCLILGQRLGEWCGHAPVLEEDIALANMALDLIGQSRALLTHAGAGQGFDEDQLAFLRDERDYLNLTMAELPRGDFAFTVVRNLFVSSWARLMWERLIASSDTELAAIAGKAVKEARYHQQHAADWVVRLADGTVESRRRIDVALRQLWPYVTEMFADDEVDAAAEAGAVGPRGSELESSWRAQIASVFDEAGLAMPEASRFISTGKRGVHTEHMGYILAEMQYLQRAFPGGVW